VSGRFRYHPVLADADQEIRQLAPARVLVVGDRVPDAIVAAESVRQVVDPEIDLPIGVYAFGDESQVEMLVVSAGGSPAAPDESASTDTTHPLASAHDWLLAWWDGAAAVTMPLFEVNAPAVLRGSGQEAHVRGRDFDSGIWWYRVRVEGRTVNVPERDLLEPDVDDDPYAWIDREPASVERFTATLTRAKLHEHLTDTVYSFRATRTIFRAYQFRPVIRLLQTGQLRLLIADEVGLGKTIEAGLVWTELDARNQANRVLVVCPSMLVMKWRAEMRERFGYELIDLDRPHLDDLVERIAEDRMPRRFAGICSLERLRVWPGLDDLAMLTPHFDLVVVDEAHAFRNSETRSHALGALLSDWADALVFLSATPLNLGNDDLYSLLELLAPGEFDDRFVLEQRLEPNAILHRLSASLFDGAKTNADRLQMLNGIEPLRFGPAVTARPEFDELTRLLGQPALSPADIALAKRYISQLHALSAVVTRTRKVEVQEKKPVREAVSIAVEWTDTEAAFYREFEAWQVERALDLELPVGFVTQMPLRLASTCLPAARDRVLDWRGRRPSEDMEGDSDADWDDSPPPPDLVELARRLGEVDTKFDAFIEHLLPIVQGGRRVLVFTFSRSALAYLQRRLSGLVRLGVMHGGVDREVRHELMQRFRDHELDVLLASRVASEGLDFEFCSAVVNYDLPWNPMEVEQRIGRIDRFGQEEEKILILNFHTPGTIESTIVERVHQRIGVFKDSIGELEPILQSRLSDIRKTMFDFTLDEEERQRRLDEMLAAIEEQRLAVSDVETASSFLSSTDDAEIDGFEQDLLSQGRYIGQPELVHLLADWAAYAPGSRCVLDRSGTHVVFQGTAALEPHLRGVQAAGERSRTEIDEFARALVDEREIVLCLDQEHARTSGHPLLSSTHPLVRAALRVPGSSQARFARVRVVHESVAPAVYLTVIAIARWRGLRPTTEFWTVSVDLASGALSGEDSGAAVLAALAEAHLDRSDGLAGADAESALAVAERALRRRQELETVKRLGMNDALVEARRISLQETHARKVGQIDRRIATLRERGNSGVVHLHEAQRRNQERLLRDAELELEDARNGSMDVEVIAVCETEVVGP